MPQAVTHSMEADFFENWRCSVCLLKDELTELTYDWGKML
jgi:hypothetical protein